MRITIDVEQTWLKRESGTHCKSVSFHRVNAYDAHFCSLFLYVYGANSIIPKYKGRTVMFSGGIMIRAKTPPPIQSTLTDRKYVNLVIDH